MYHNSHNNSPIDGSPYCAGIDCEQGSSWVIKGGGYQSPINKITGYACDQANGASSNIGARIVRR